MKKYLVCALCLLIAALPLLGLGETQPEFPFAEDPYEDRDIDDLGLATHSATVMLQYSF